MSASVSNKEIFETLTGLNSVLSRPVWLFGGVAVDFLVGRWTRPHGDIDINAYASDRRQLARELNAIGFHTNNSGWLTHWARGRLNGALKLYFLSVAQRTPEFRLSRRMIRSVFRVAMRPLPATSIRIATPRSMGSRFEFAVPR